jgi:hypothetical protein
MKFLKRLLGLGGKDDKQEKDSFHCGKCDKDFDTEAELKIHKHKHKNEAKGTTKGKDKTSSSKETKKSSVDYDELATHTIKEVKSRVKGMDDVDYEELLQAEKDNKDRKTMKSWLKDRMD